MTLDSGTNLGHYQILSPLGFGGMGEVYRALDMRLDREVALKVVPPRLSKDSLLRSRFEREAKALAALSHPNILTIHDFETSENLSFAVMELLEGETLRSLIARSALDWRRALEIGVEIAQGLAAAHSKGIIHRDLKPDNIFITADGQVKILDFGLARLDYSIWDQTRFSQLPTIPGETVPGMVIGTVGYMSPEQVLGMSVDSRSDIFSFGCVLYEMISGISPFLRHTAPETMTAILKDEPPPVAKSGKTIPPELDRVLMHCLKKNGEERFHSAHDLAFALKEILRGPHSTISRPMLPAIHHPHAGRYSLIALLVIVLTLGSFFIATRNQTGGETRIPIAVADFVNETNEKDLDGLSGMLITSLEQSRKLSVLTRSRMFDMLRQMGKGDVKRIDEETGKAISRKANVNALVLGTIRKFDRLYSIDLQILDPVRNEYIFAAKEEGIGKESIPSLIDKLSERTRVGLNEKSAALLPNQSVASVTTTNLAAYQHYFQGEQYINQLDFKKAENEFHTAIRLDPYFALAYYRLAYVLSWSHETRAREPIMKALEMIDKVPEKERYLLRAEMAFVENDLDEAIGLCRQLLKIYPDEKEALFNIGDWSYHKGDYLTAITYLKRVLQVDPSFQRALQHIVWTYDAKNDKDNLLKYAKQYVAKAPSEEAFSLLGGAYLSRNEFDQALRIYDHAVQVFPESAVPYSGRAAVYQAKRDFMAAERELKRLVAPENPFDKKMTGYSYLANIYGALGRYNEAIASFDKILELNTPDNNEKVRIHAEKAIRYMVWWKNKDLALKEIEQAERLHHSPNYGTIKTLFYAYLRVGEFEKAGRLATHQIVLLGSPRAYLEAHRHLQRKEYPAAIEKFLQVARESAHSGDKNAARRDLVECYLEAGEFAKAVNEIVSLQQSHPLIASHPRYFYLLAKGYEGKGDRAEAAENYRKFIESWNKADTQSADLVDAKRRLARLNA